MNDEKIIENKDVYERMKQENQWVELEELNEDIPYPIKGFFDFCNKNDVWKIIEKSKENTHFNSKLQYNNLIRILKDYSIDDIKAFKRTWDDIVYEYREWKDGIYRTLYELMEFKNHDVFHFDFNNWLVAQGKELFDLYRKNGADAITSYINDNNIKKEDYTFECIYYAFDIFDVYTNSNKYIIKYAVMEEFEGCASNFTRLLQDFNMEIKIDRNTNQRTGEVERYDKYFVVFNSIQELMEFRNRLEDVDIKIMNKYTDFGDNVSIEPTILICNDY
jgi:hypothetical protein